MDNLVLIWFISISDEMSSALTLVGAILVAVFGLIFSNVWRDHIGSKDFFTHQDHQPFVRWCTKGFVSGLVLVVIGAFFPSPKNLMVSYAVVEGSKVVTAENVEEVASQVGRRMDTILDIIDRGVNKVNPGEGGGDAKKDD